MLDQMRDWTLVCPECETTIEARCAGFEPVIVHLDGWHQVTGTTGDPLGIVDFIGFSDLDTRLAIAGTDIVLPLR